MNTSLIYIILLSILFLLLIWFISLLIKETRFLKIEKRIANYSLTSVIDDSVPFFERIYRLIIRLIKKVSIVLSKSEVLKKYSINYDKYMTYEEKKKISNIDYVSVKFLISILIGILYIISSIIRKSFDSYILLIVMLIGFFILDIYLKILQSNRKKQIENDLLSAIIIMNNAFKSGMNIMQAVDIVKSELTGPIQDEFKKISVDITYGLNLETVFERFYNRIGVEDIKYITSSLSLINKTGGNIVKVFNAIEKNFYDKKKIKDEMNSLTSSSVFMFRLLIIIPVILAVVMYLLNPLYFKPLFTNFLGRIILLVMLLLFILYILIVKSIMKVDNDG